MTNQFSLFEGHLSIACKNDVYKIKIHTHFKKKVVYTRKQIMGTRLIEESHSGGIGSLSLCL